MTPLLRGLVVALAAGGAILGQAGCSNPTRPSPPPPTPALTLACPSAVVVGAAPEVPAPVTYPAPIPSGGTAPVSVKCSVPSGGAFAAGDTDVVCTATDSATPPHQASCVFTVSVRQEFTVEASRFLAFGDSITAGAVEYNDSVASILEIERDKAYPTVLRDLLAQRYPRQDISVLNAGYQGEPAGCALGASFCGASRISRVIDESRPHALLLLQGVIDLSEGGLSSVSQMLDGLKFMVRDARRRGVTHIFISTLLPQKPGSRAWAMDAIVPANARIRDLAVSEGVYLVDAYAGMVGQEAIFIGKDGLHPTPEGYQALARIFFEAIRDRLETVVTTPGGVQRTLDVSAAGPHVEVGPQFRRPPVRLR